MTETKARDIFKITLCFCVLVQVPVVQTLDSVIHQINHYSADKFLRETNNALFTG